MKTKKMFSALAGSFALALVAFAGCTDSTIDATDTAVVEKYSAYAVDTQTLETGEIASLDRILSVGGEIPSYDSTLTPDSSSCGSRDANDVFRAEAGKGGRGGHGRGRGHGHGPKERRGLGELIPRSFRTAIDSLNLTAEQDSLIALCFQQARACGIDAQQAFLAARRAIDAEMRPALDAIRDQVKAGTMTREEARTAIDSIKASYADRVEEMNSTFKAAIAACRSSLDSCVRGHLTAEQLVIWEELTGQIPG